MTSIGPKPITLPLFDSVSPNRLDLFFRLVLIPLKHGNRGIGWVGIASGEIIRQTTSFFLSQSEYFNWKCWSSVRHCLICPGCFGSNSSCAKERVVFTFGIERTLSIQLLWDLESIHISPELLLDISENSLIWLWMLWRVNL